MNEVLRPFLRKFVVVYLDNIIIFSRSIDEHLKHLQTVFNRLREVKLKIKPSKCEFFKKELKFLGYRVSAKGIHTDPSNTIKIQKATPPRNEKEVRGFLGLCQFYRKFIQNFQKIAEPLYKLLRAEEKYYQQVWTKNGWISQEINNPTWHEKWNHEQQQAFEELKHRLITAPVLAHPNFQKPFILYTDASTIGLGAVLAQVQEDGKERPIAYHARTLRGAEKNYPITELECLAVIWAVEKLRHYLQNNHQFILYTDHIALKNLKGHNNPSKRRARWMETLAQYDFEIRHRPGKKMGHVDFLSREVTQENTQEIEASTSQIDHFDQPPEVPKEFLDEPLEEEPIVNTSRWEEVHFICQGWNTYPCQTRRQNPRYYSTTTVCNQTDHHSHWYCMNCSYCYNPLFWKPQPPETAECYCIMDNSDVLTENGILSSETEWESESIPTRNMSPIPVDNPEENPNNWTIYTPAYTYNQPMLDQQYADHILQVTNSQNQEELHWCLKCNKHLPRDRFVHNCVYGYKLGQQHAEMRSECLSNTPWWEIPYDESSDNNQEENYYADDEEYYSIPNSPSTPQSWYNEDEIAEYYFEKYINY
jgi:hypothetical protein